MVLDEATPESSSSATTPGLSERAAEGLILCGDMKGVAQCSQSHISKLNSRWTALPTTGSDVVGGKLDPSGTAGALSPVRPVASWYWSR